MAGKTGSAGQEAQGVRKFAAVMAEELKRSVTEMKEYQERRREMVLSLVKNEFRLSLVKLSCPGAAARAMGFRSDDMPGRRSFHS